jgi:hypothetical protein
MESFCAQEFFINKYVMDQPEAFTAFSENDIINVQNDQAIQRIKNPIQRKIEEGRYLWNMLDANSKDEYNRQRDVWFGIDSKEEKTKEEKTKEKKTKDAVNGAPGYGIMVPIPKEKWTGRDIAMPIYMCGGCEDYQSAYDMVYDQFVKIFLHQLKSDSYNTGFNINDRLSSYVTVRAYHRKALKFVFMEMAHILKNLLIHNNVLRMYPDFKPYLEQFTMHCMFKGKDTCNNIRDGKMNTICAMINTGDFNDPRKMINASR